MQNLATKTVREIALEMPQTTRIFEEFKIDYCCGGRKLFSDACRNVGANPDDVMQRIDDALASGENEFNWAQAALTDLIGHIEEKHHVFTKNELEHLEPLMDKVARVHGENHPELLELQQIFRELSDDLTPHMHKEEMVLFPYVIDLERRAVMNLPPPTPFFGSVQNPVRMMMSEHDVVGDLLRNMRALSGDFTTPPGACPSFTGLYHRLEELERDLHRHIHLENNLLFPRAIELEQKSQAA